MEQQVFRCPVVLDIVGVVIEQGLLHFVGTVVDILHVGGVALQHTETNVKSLRSQRTILFNFLSGTANALFADFADVLITSFIGFALFVRRFGELDHNKLAVSTIFGVQLHNGVGGSG